MWGKIKCKGVKNKRIDCRVEVLSINIKNSSVERYVQGSLSELDL